MDHRLFHLGINCNFDVELLYKHLYEKKIKGVAKLLENSYDNVIGSKNNWYYFHPVQARMPTGIFYHYPKIHGGLLWVSGSTQM